MRLFKQRRLAMCLLELQETRETCQRIAYLDGGAQVFPVDQWEAVERLLVSVQELTAEAGFDAAHSNVALTIVNHKANPTPPNVSAVDADLRHVKDMLVSDVWKCRFLQVPAHLSKCVDNDAMFGLDVAKAFPSARFDVREAGNCLAADCNTASVFHLMRVVEWGLRAFGAHLGFRQLRTRRKPGAKQKYAPISHLEWEKTLDKLQGIVDSRVEKLRPGKRKQELQEFYYPALQEIRAMRDAWRNHVMHTRREYDADEAASIRGHVERLMKKLATRIKET